MNIVEQVARIIDSSAFVEWTVVSSDMAGPKARTELEEKRRKLKQARALHQATMILKLALECRDLAKELADDEIERWNRLGVPMSEPILQETVRAKYAKD